MADKKKINVLSISDKVIEELRTPQAAKKYKDVDILLACGDLPYYYVEDVFETLGVPTFYVRGNHANPIEYGERGKRNAPLGATDLHGRVVHFNNILLAGFEGSLRYKPGHFMYSQGEMWLNVFRIIPRLLFNKLVYGRYLDVLVTHSPPWGIHDENDHIHSGFKAFIWLLDTFKPTYHFHGHIHVYENETQTTSVYQDTKIINTYGFRHTVVQLGKKHYGQINKLPPKSNLGSALEDFRDARRKASLQNIFSSITGRSDNLMSFEDVREKLNTGSAKEKGIQDIPLDAIVGSVGRYDDFNRKFFPRQDSDEARWTRVKKVTDVQPEMPPIDVYQIGETYFVVDGNHRVSIARTRGNSHIPARVSEIETKVVLTPEDDVDDIIVKAEQVRFLEETKLDESRPDIDFILTLPGRYIELLNHIAAHQFKLEFDGGKEVRFTTAAADWVDHVYQPIVRTIWRQGLLRDFPGRSPTDLYLWLVKHRANLGQTIGWRIDSEKAASSLVQNFSKRPKRLVKRYWDRLIAIFRPEDFDPGPAPGEWHNITAAGRRDDHLITSCLVPLFNSDESWKAYYQAVEVARYEDAVLRGLHIITDESYSDDRQIARIKEEFLDRCATDNVQGEFVVGAGGVSRTIARRGRWNDLVIFNLEHPPEDKPLARMQSGVRRIIQSSSRPVMTVPNVSKMKNALLAYDGSPKANEAMFLATYMAKSWNINLTVFTVSPENKGWKGILDRAEDYIGSRGVKAEFHTGSGPIVNTLIRVAKENESDIIIMGGYGHRPVFEVMLGSTVDRVLLEYKNPVLICR
ncbi:MAG: universal stress protein [Chloroflexota bacterium]